MGQKITMQRFWVWVLAFLFLLSSTEAALAFDISRLIKKPSPMLTPPVPSLKLMAPLRKVNGSNLFFSGTVTNPSYLYDGDETTMAVAETPTTITLDLGSLQRLGGIRFLPGKENPNRCLGTVFSISKNNRNFLPVATIEPLGGGDFPSDWQDLSFGSSGDARYVRLEIPAGASFAEIEWLSYPGWNYAGRNLIFDLYAFDIQETFVGNIALAIYNKNGVLKQLVQQEETFVENVPAFFSLEVLVRKREAGDNYRILVWKPDGTPALSQALSYYDNDGSSQLSLSNLFSDDMLLQAEKPVTIWGSAPTNSNVTVSLENNNGGIITQTTIAKQGTFSVNLGSFSPGGDYQLTIRCGNEKKLFRHITFGDLWLCVGQSNMDYFMVGGADTTAYLENDPHADNPNIRLLNLWNLGIAGSGAPTGNLPLGYGKNAWEPMTRDSANYCSAVGYFIAQDLEQTYHNPIGLLSVAVGDTEINRWIPYGDTYGSFTSTDGGLFHNRVAPFDKLQIKGILMYQGEADQYRTFLTTEEYRDAMAGLVDRYRNIWGADTPFYWAQLTRYKKDESAIREGQRLALFRIKNPESAGIISLIDIYGEFKSGAGNCREDIHPHQKQVVAERFLRYIKRDVYGEDISVSGPVYQSMRIDGSTIELTFHTTGNLALLPVSQYADKLGQNLIKEQNINTNLPQEFEIAGDDGIFVRADAVLEGNQVLLSNPKIPNPVMARYAWGAYPEIPNLTDETGLPALSFSTHLY